MKKSLTVTHIQRPFYRGSDGYHTSKSLPSNFSRRVPFYTSAEGEGHLFHVKDKTQYVSLQDMKDLKAKGLVIELPYPVDISADQSLYDGLASSVYAADKHNPKWEEVTYFCALESLSKHEMVSYVPRDTVMFYDLLVVTHLMTPAEGYPSEEGVLRAMTAVTQTYTEEQYKHVAFGPKRIHVHGYKEKWKQWEEEGRLIKLDQPILFNPGQWNVRDKDLGQGFWTDYTKEHYYGKVPKEAKCVLYTHVRVGENKPLENEIVRRHAYRAVYYLFDVGLTVSGSNPPSEDRFNESEANMLELEEKKQVVKLPKPLRIVYDNYMFWTSAKGDFYLAHALKPNDHPHVFIMNVPLVAELPASKDKFVQYYDFSETAA